MHARDALVGIDVGTSAIKVVALDAGGAPLAARSAPTPTQADGEGHVEHDADAVWGAVAQLLRELCDALGDARPLAVATTSMGEAGLPVDREGRALRPLIGWQDARTRRYVAWWEQAAGAARLFDLTGMALDPTFGVSKLMWVRDEQPALLARARWWLSAADLVTLRLADVAATDHSLASRTMAFDQRRREWSTELLELARLDRALLPPAQVSGTVVGAVTAAAARATGLPEGTPVVLGGHDRLCGAFAARGGERALVDSAGTAETVVASLASYPGGEPAEMGHIPCYADVEPGRWARSARVGPSGALVEWARTALAGDGAAPASYEELLGLLAPGGFGGVVCLPTFGRPATPRWDVEAARGAFVGLTTAHGRGDLLRALLEGVAFSVRANVEALASSGSASGTPLRIEGGSTRNAPWMQMRADVLGAELHALELPQATALGAALLAGVGAGCFADHDAAGRAAPSAARTWTPDPARAAEYARVYEQVWQPLAAALAPLHRALG